LGVARAGLRTRHRLKTDIHDHLNSSDSRIETIQSETVLGPVKRHQIAQSRPKGFFVRIDDDVF
jgi:hypothetical protein